MPIIARCAPSCQRPPRSRAELLAHLVPDLLGVDQHAVQVEDDRLDHAARYSPPRRRSGERPLAPELDRARPRRRRACGRRPSCSATSRALEPAERAREQRPGVAARAASIPSQSASGGTPRAKCCASPSWSAARSADGEPPGVAQQLVDRRLPADRDRRRAAVERQRDERADGDAEPLPVDVHGDDARPRPGSGASPRAARRRSSRRDHTDRWLVRLAEVVAGEELPSAERSPAGRRRGRTPCARRPARRCPASRRGRSSSRGSARRAPTGAAAVRGRSRSRTSPSGCARGSCSRASSPAPYAELNVST